MTVHRILLATALPPSRGEVRVLGRDPEVPAERTDIRRRSFSRRPTAVPMCSR